MKYSQALSDDQYKSSNIASLRSVISILITLRSCTHLSAVKYTVDLIVIDTKI